MSYYINTFNCTQHSLMHSHLSNEKVILNGLQFTQVFVGNSVLSPDVQHKSKT